MVDECYAVTAYTIVWVLLDRVGGGGGNWVPRAFSKLFYISFTYYDKLSIHCFLPINF